MRRQGPGQGRQLSGLRLIIALGRESKMAQYRLHCNGASGHSYKIALYLNCDGLDWEPVGVDFARGQTREAEWRAKINTMGEVPVLEVDGQCMSQSAAILLWLAETTGAFAPAGGQRFEAMRWLFFDNHKFTNNYAMHRFQNCLTPQPADPAVLAFLRSRVESSFSIADKHLEPRPFMLGERPTIVEFSFAGYVYYPAAETGFDLAAEYPAIDAWRRRVAALPGWKPPYEMMPVGTSPPVRAP
jgi:glutathione S-transferase